MSEVYRTIEEADGTVVELYTNGKTRRYTREEWAHLQSIYRRMQEALRPRTYRRDPRTICPGCGEPAIDGKVTCGDVACGSTTGQDR